ncbi:MAG: hypothetical protein WCY25_07845 [Moheibacter sp.]
MRKILFLIILSTIFLSFKSSDGVEIKWNFAKYQKITYSYQQNMVMQIDSFVQDHSGIEGEGTIDLLIIDSALAEVRIKIVNGKKYELDSIGNKINEVLEFIPQVLVITGIEEDDISKIKNKPDTEMLVKSLFPVLKQTITKGEKENYPLNFRFNYMGKMLDTSGDSFLDLVEIEKDICHLELEYDLKSIQNEKPDYSIKGKSKVKFDSENQYFTEGVLQMSMRVGEEFLVDNTINYKLISVE